jgi:hypothetical protein
MHSRLAGLAAGLVLLVLAPSAMGANVSVRVEGTGDTLVPRTAATTGTGTFSKDGDPSHQCPANSATGALQAATAGDWSGRWASFGDYEIQTIKGETHASNAGDASGTYWAFWLNYQYSSTGGCGTPMQDGDDVLFFPSCFGTGCDREPTPLRITSIPGSAAPGAAFDVRVVQYSVTFDSEFNATTTQAPAAGATVSADGRSFTAGADGVAHVTVPDRGLAGVRATKAGYVRSTTEPVCVDCGTPPPAQPGAPAARDTTAPSTTLALKSGSVFSRRKAPRVLRGSVDADPSGLLAVKLKLTRKVGRKCSYFSGRRERFVPMRCGHGSFFKIGDRADWSYLLPKRLGRGRYVLDAKAIDGAYNRGPVARVRFRVK